MIGRTEDRPARLLAPALALALLAGAASGTSCIIPDHGIVALVDCGVRWCATAEYAEALNDDGNPVQVHEPQPDGSSDWVTGCVCMTPSEDLILRAHAGMKYELLSHRILDAARGACIDQAIANDLDPDPPPPQDATLALTCTDAVTTIFRDGCCNMRNDLCGGSTQSCDADLDPTEGEEPGPFVPDTDGSGSDGGLDSTGGDTDGGMSSLEPFYAEVQCEGTTCTIGQSLIHAMLTAPEAVLAEGTSLTFVSSEGVTIGMELRGVEPDGLAARLGLRDGDVIVRVGTRPLRNEAELMAAADWAMTMDEVDVTVLRDGEPHSRTFVRAH